MRVASNSQFNYIRCKEVVSLSYDKFLLTAGMNLLSKFCIAVSASRKLNCVAVGVICVAVFFWCVGEKNS